MTMQEILEWFRELEPEEKLKTLHALWSELSDEQSEHTLDDVERDFLEERIEQVENDPRGDRPWKEVRNELLAKR